MDLFSILESLIPHRSARMSAIGFFLHASSSLSSFYLVRAFFLPSVNPFLCIGTCSLAAVAAAKFLQNKEDFPVWWRAAFLGSTLSAGFVIATEASQEHRLFGWYAVVLSVFHYFEYFVTAVSNPSNLSTDSYLLNHSWAYGIAAAASWTEFFVEAWLFPSFKLHRTIPYFGLVLCTVGDLLRKVAMVHAGYSFNHIVQSTKRKDHVLITEGIYGWCRHPSYVGWFYWSVGTQFVLCNPVCGLIYSIVSWKFFDERVLMEEYMLLSFFGEQYRTYQQRVGTGLPGIKGYLRPQISHPN